MSTKKVISILLICCFLVSSILVVGVSAADAPAWNFDATGTLTINAPSALADYASAQDVPWNLFTPLITTVSIDPAISYIGTYSLNNLNATIEIDNGNTEIAPHAFDNPGENFIIQSVFNSPVHTYAKENGLTFEGIAVVSGECGNNARWKIYPDGTLHILGSGPMTDYYRDPMSTPWYSHASTIKKVLVDEGITFVSPYTVFSANACMSATILGADTQVSATAFQMVHNSFTIFGHIGSSAEEVAQTRGYQFEPFTIADGTCGINVTWTLYTNGLLRIDGNGAMTDVNDPKKLTYFDYGDQITAIEVGENITKVSDFAYFNYKNCVSFTVLNPGAIMQKNAVTFPNDNLDIRGFYGSTAQAYADEKNISFAPMPILAGGSCGENVSWYLYENGLLKVSGAGAMTSAPWRTASYNKTITTIDIGGDITNITAGTCYNLESCKKFIIRNPSATIHTSAIRHPAEGLTVYGEFESTAETYASQIGVAFDSYMLDTGSCGTNVSWTLYTNGHLKINGKGAMTDYGGYPYNVPWFTYRSFITSIEIGSGVTYLSPYTLFDQENCTSFTVLNKNATFGSETTIVIPSDDLVIYGYKGSTAETFAASKSITFVPLD